MYPSTLYDAHSLSRPPRHSAHRPQLTPGCTSTFVPAASPLGPGSTPLPEIEMVERARPHAHERLAAAGHRIGRILVAQHVDAAVLVEAHRLH
jgi:hypothetical protein